MEISTVVGCRLACKVCPQTVHVRKFAERGGGDRQMSLATFQACFDRLPVEVEAMFAGMAEPWLNPAATDMVEYAHRQGRSITIFTTLSGMTLADVDRLSRIPMRLGACVHLPDAVGIMHLKVDDGYLAVLRAFVAKVRCHFTLFGPLHPAVRAALGHDVKDDSGGLVSRAGNLADRKIDRKTGPLMCSACGPKIHHNVLLPNGDVALCCNDYSLRHVLGNLLTDSYDALFTGEAYQQVMRGLAGDEAIDIACRTCEHAVPV